MSPEQYLEIERAAEHKSEFFNGEMFPMAGTTLVQVMINDNLVTILSTITSRKIGYAPNIMCCSRMANGCSTSYLRTKGFSRSTRSRPFQTGGSLCQSQVLNGVLIRHCGIGKMGAPSRCIALEQAIPAAYEAANASPAAERMYPKKYTNAIYWTHNHGMTKVLGSTIRTRGRSVDRLLKPDENRNQPNQPPQQYSGQYC